VRLLSVDERAIGSALGGGAVRRLARAADDTEEEDELEDGSLDPDELEGDPPEWDEGADDELG
jgi:hypothetical protein